MKDKITNIVISTLREVIQNSGLKIPELINSETRLIGSTGVLDSLAFVSFLVAVEQKINQEMNKCISLNSEKAFSLASSPFRCVGVLVDYITENWIDEK